MRSIRNRKAGFEASARALDAPAGRRPSHDANNDGDRGGRGGGVLWTAPTARPGKATSGLERVVRLTSPVGLLVVWEILSRLGALDQRFFPPPSIILRDFFDYLKSGELIDGAGVTLFRVVVGFAMGGTPGIVLGLLAGTNRFARAALNPIIGAAYPIPKIAILPLVILIFGVGNTTLFVVVAIGVFFPVMINTARSVLAIEPIYFDVGKNVGASRVRQFFTIALPGAVPGIASGIRVAWGMALLIIVGSEFIASRSGLGYLIYDGWQTFQVGKLYAGLITISIIGVMSFALFEWLERILVPWQPEP